MGVEPLRELNPCLLQALSSPSRSCTMTYNQVRIAFMERHASMHGAVYGLVVWEIEAPMDQNVWKYRYCNALALARVFTL